MTYRPNKSEHNVIRSLANGRNVVLRQVDLTHCGRTPVRGSGKSYRLISIANGSLGMYLPVSSTTFFSLLDNGMIALSNTQAGPEIVDYGITDAGRAMLATLAAPKS